MSTLIALVRKELLVLCRDWHALLLLFIMPACFILIMSLALRDTFASHGRVSLTYVMVDQDLQPLSQGVATRLQENLNFRELILSAPLEDLQSRVRNDQIHFLVLIPKGFSAAMRAPSPLALEIFSAPGVEPANAKLFDSALREAVAKVYITASVQAIKKEMGSFLKADALVGDMNLDAVDKLVVSGSLEDGGQMLQLPSSVQQNVPAWLIFAMFFIAIPLSTTWVQERSQGTLLRLRSMGVPRSSLLIGKLLPYLFINLLQVLLMLGVGVFVVPLLGGDALTLGHAPLALAWMALSLSFASVSYALLVANLVSTSEQATIFTGVSNLLLAALGGVMVPRFVMPLAMQKISLASPMAWGLEGFLDIFLRQGGWAQVLPWSGLLFAFGILSLSLATFRLGRLSGK
jgi:ABC-2 type transport system permease protein